MPLFLVKLAQLFLSKKKIIGWISAVILAALSMVVGMNAQEFKDAVCSAELPKEEIKIEAPAPPQPAPQAPKDQPK